LQFFSLQKKPVGSEEQIAFRGLVDLSADLHDFADTAAALTQMDLIIRRRYRRRTSGRRVGRPAWTLLPYAADWRWMKDRTDSPWYRRCGCFGRRSEGVGGGDPPDSDHVGRHETKKREDVIVSHVSRFTLQYQFHKINPAQTPSPGPGCPAISARRNRAVRWCGTRWCR